MEIGIISRKNLPETERNYLLNLEEGKSVIPVYYRDEEGEVFFIEDFILRNNKVFEKTAPANLFRGGALLVVTFGNDRMVVIPDERYGWLRLVGGIARFEEGKNLVQAAIREGVIEELVVVSSDESIRSCPREAFEDDGKDVWVPYDLMKIEGWNFQVKDVWEAGKVSVLDYFFNNQQHALEAVIQWDLSDLDIGEVKILHNEDWFKGGMSGIVPVLIDMEGRILGFFSGRQGLIEVPVADEVMKLHPTLRQVLDLLKANKL